MPMRPQPPGIWKKDFGHFPTKAFAAQVSIQIAVAVLLPIPRGEILHLRESPAAPCVNLSLGTGGDAQAKSCESRMITSFITLR